MPPILSVHTWVSLSPEQRSRIRSLFNIPRSGSTEVRDGVIVTDGTTTNDFRHLTIEKMQGYLVDTSTDFHNLFDKVLARVQDGIEVKPVVLTLDQFEVAPNEPTEVLTPNVPKKRGRPSKNNA